MITIEQGYSFGGTYHGSASGCAIQNNPFTGGLSCPTGYTDFSCVSMCGLASPVCVHGCYATTTPLASTTAFAIQISQGSSTIPVDNPVIDLYAGFIIFFITFAGVIWFFRKR